MASIQFFFNEVPVFHLERRKLKKFIQGLFEQKQVEFQGLVCIFCSDQYLLRINKQFLNHNYYTDIITFNLSSSTAVDGELYISSDRVKENAKKEGIDLTEEVHRVIIHGILHLCGYNDKTKVEKGLMRKEENRLLKLYFSS